MKSDVTSKNRISKKREDMEEVKFLLYSYLEDDVNVGVIVKNNTLWLTQKSMAGLFGGTWENTTISKIETVVNRGFIGEIKEEVEYYNLDVIISVGYRINSIDYLQ